MSQPKQLSVELVDQRLLHEEMAEVQGATLLIMRSVKDIEVLMYRISVCADDIVANNTLVSDMLADWATFKVKQWKAIQQLSLTQNWLGA